MLSAVFTLQSPSFALAAGKSDDLLAGDEDEVVAPPKPEAKKAEESKPAAADPHAALYSKEQFPSATQCATCHATIYNEWRTSNHAYASISPVFHKFEQKLNELTSGTVANFCGRCHATVGTTLGEVREGAIWDKSPVGREGITCITCHRTNLEFGKVNGERHINPGDITEPVYGPTDAKGLTEVLKDKDYYKVTDTKSGLGMSIHRQAVKFETLTKAEFCMSCHQVQVHPDIKLEVVWDQYRASPAISKGITCQDCHMGKVPGRAEGYATGPAAVVNGKPINSGRMRTNHSFYGPGYPIAHPGIFPHNPKAAQFDVKEWLTFDYRAGWGTRKFEDEVAHSKGKSKFPKEWDSIDDRQTARAIVDENLALLEKKKDLRRQVMENGSKITGPFFDDKPGKGKRLSFHYLVANTNNGHNLPSGSLGAQPEIWMNVALIDPSGKNVWESGYLDKAGDMADLHSEEVQQGRLAHDNQLFNLQTKFLTTNVKGTDREMFLPVNFDLDQLPFIRPAAAPNSVLNHPAFVRMEARSIPPEGDRKANYSIPGELLKKPGKYKLAVRMRSRAEPIYFMKFIRSTEEMKRSMNEWMLDIHPYTVEFSIHE